MRLPGTWIATPWQDQLPGRADATAAPGTLRPTGCSSRRGDGVTLHSPSGVGIGNYESKGFEGFPAESRSLPLPGVRSGTAFGCAGAGSAA